MKFKIIVIFKNNVVLLKLRGKHRIQVLIMEPRRKAIAALILALIIAPTLTSAFVSTFVVSASTGTKNVSTSFTKVWGTTFRGPVYDLSVDEKGSKLLVAVVSPPTLKLYDLTDKPRLAWSYDLGKKVYLQSAAISPDGSKVTALVYWQDANKNYRFKVITISLLSSKVLWETKTFGDPGWDVAYSRDGSLVIVSPQSNYVMALRAVDGKVVWRTELPVHSTYGVTVSRDVVYVGAFRRSPYSGVVAALSLRSGKVLWLTGNLDDAVLTVTLSRDASLLFCGLGIDHGNNKYGGKVIALNPRTGKKIWETGEFSDYVWGVEEIPGTDTLIVGVESGVTPLISAKTGDVISKVSINDGWDISCIALLKRRKILALGLENDANQGALFIYEVRTAEEESVTTQHTQQIEATKPSTYGVAWVSPKFSDASKFMYLDFDVSQNNKFLAILSNQSGAFHIVSLSNGKVLQVIKPPLKLSGKHFALISCKVSPDGQVIYVGMSPISSVPTVIFAYDLSKNRMIWHREINSVTSKMALSPNGKYLVMVALKPFGDYHGLVMLNAETGSTILNMTTYMLRHYMKLSDDQVLQLWRKYITIGFSFSKDSTTLYLVMRDLKERCRYRVIGMILNDKPRIVWSSKPITIESLAKHASPDSVEYEYNASLALYEVQASPDGNYVAVSYSIHGRELRVGVALVSIKSGEVVWSELIDGSGFPLHEKPFTPDGRRMIYISDPRGPKASIRILDTRTLRIVGEINLTSDCIKILDVRPEPSGGVIALLSNNWNRYGGWLVKFEAGADGMLSCDSKSIRLLAGSTTATGTQQIMSEGTSNTETLTLTTQRKRPQTPYMTVIGVALLASVLVIALILKLIILKREPKLPVPPPPP